jgi:Fic family protein
MSYHPPYTITPKILQQVADIVGLLTRWQISSQASLAPQLRRSNCIRSIQVSLAIENNSLTIDQVTAVLEGERVLDVPREIQELHNAFAAYQQLPHWQVESEADCLMAYVSLMSKY